MKHSYLLLLASLLLSTHTTYSAGRLTEADQSLLRSWLNNQKELELYTSGQSTKSAIFTLDSTHVAAASASPVTLRNFIEDRIDEGQDYLKIPIAGREYTFSLKPNLNKLRQEQNPQPPFDTSVQHLGGFQQQSQHSHVEQVQVFNPYAMLHYLLLS